VTRVLARVLVSSFMVLLSVSALSQQPTPTPTPTPAAQSAGPIIPAPPQIAAKAWFLVDAKSGKVIMEGNADERLAPASLTKMMTGYVLSQAIAGGKAKWEDTAHITHNSWAQNPQFIGSSLMWVDINSDVSLKDLYYGLVISSGNDASVAIAEHLAGAEDSFAEMMNSEAARLGMSNSHFMNSHGLSHPEHYTTARDLATLARAMINDHPADYAVYAERYFTYNNIRQMNRNELLGEPGVDGIKTGHTDEAGYCLVSSAERDGMRLVAVVMGAGSRRARTDESRKMLGYGFRFYETVKVLAANTSVTTEPVKVWAGAQNAVMVGAAHDIYVTIPRGRAAELKAAAVDLSRGIKAPVTAGQELGRISVTLGEEEVLREPLIALDSVERGGFFRVLWDSLVLFFLQLFGKG